jgi:hypothetical protein
MFISLFVTQVGWAMHKISDRGGLAIYPDNFPIEVELISRKEV